MSYKTLQKLFGKGVTPQRLREEIFSDTQLIVNKESNKKISKSEVFKTLSKSRGNFIVKPQTSSVQSWANMCEALLREYNVFVNVYEYERTRDGLHVSAKNYRPYVRN